MNVCPVCEAAILTPICEVCGHVFAVAAVPAALVPRLPELELPVVSTPLEDVPQLPELEATRFPPAPAPDSWTEGEWERNASAAAPDVAAGGLADLDRGREAEATEPVVLPAGEVTCRYCRNVQAAGLLCERCGMRLPWSLPTGPAPGVPDADALVRCLQCGERTYARDRCASCGARLSPSE